MKLNKILTTIALAASIVATSSCSDDFLTNAPQGSLNDGVMNDPEAVELLVNSAYAALVGKFDLSQDTHWFPMTNWTYGEVRSDNAYKGGGGTGDGWEANAMERNDIQADNGFLDGKWFQLYIAVGRSNAALKVLEKCDENVMKTKASRIAEMKVLRGHFNFELSRLFNKFAYVDETMEVTDHVNVPNDKYTRDEILGMIARDMVDASKVLPENQPEVGRINANVARAYAAKVKLYQAYKQDETTHAIVSIDKDLLKEVVELIDAVKGKDLLADFQMLDMLAYDNGIESIFAMQCAMNDGSDSAGRINWSNLLNSPGGTSPYHGDGFFLPSQDLINAYQTDENGLPVFDYQSKPDYAWVTKYIAANSQLGIAESCEIANTTPNVDPRLDFVTGRPGITYKGYSQTPCMASWVRDQGTYGYNSAKRFWVSPESGDMYPGWPWGASALNWQFIRYADLLLYKAEALIEIGEASGLETARNLINRIRKRAMDSEYVKDFNDPTKDAANYKIGLYPAAGWTQDYARKALRTEMRLEKALEGERFYDLVRWGIAAQTINAYYNAEKGKRIYYEGANFDAGEEYFPIPVNQYNFSLGKYTQNPGYPAF